MISFGVRLFLVSELLLKHIYLSFSNSASVTVSKQYAAIQYKSIFVVITFVGQQVQGRYSTLVKLIAVEGYYFKLFN